MDESLVELLRCPDCKGELELEVGVRDEDSAEVLKGVLRCGACPYDYPVEDGIPNLLPQELQEQEKREKEKGKESAT